MDRYDDQDEVGVNARYVSHEQAILDIDPLAITRQSRRTLSVAMALACFSLFGALFGCIICLLDLALAGSGVTIYKGTYNPHPPTPRSVRGYGGHPYSINYYSGVWYGVANVVCCFLALIYCVRVMKGVRLDTEYILDNGCIRVVGLLLSILFGLLAAAGVGAIVCSGLTAARLYIDWNSGDCTYQSAGSACVCSKSYYVSGVVDCSYVWNTLYRVYQTITVMSAGLMVMNIIISSLFCGALCCCAVHGAYTPVQQPRHRLRSLVG